MQTHSGVPKDGTHSRAKVDAQFGMTITESTVHKRTSYQVEIWSETTGEALATTGWHAEREAAFDEAYKIAARFIR